MPAHRALEDLNLGFYQKTGYKMIGWGSGAPSNSTDIGYSHGAIYIRTGGTTGADAFYVNTAASSTSSSTWQPISAANAAAAFDTITATGAVAFDSTLSVAGAITPTGGVGPAGGFTFSPRTCHTGGVPAQISTEGTDTAIVVTEMYVAEVFIPANCTVTGAAVMWGSATNGNAKVCLFNSAGTRVAISASTDVSGYTADSYGSLIAFTSTYAAKGPATYYLGVICDDNTNKVNTHILGAFGAGKITGLVYATESGYASITVPTTFTTGLGPIATLY